MKTGTCHWCLAVGEITRDHVQPKSCGGGIGDNLVPACPTCNFERGVLTDFHLRAMKAILSATEREARKRIHSLWRSYKRNAIGKLAFEWRRIEAAHGVFVIAGMITRPPSIEEIRSGLGGVRRMTA